MKMLSSSGRKQTEHEVILSVNGTGSVDRSHGKRQPKKHTVHKSSSWDTAKSFIRIFSIILGTAVALAKVDTEVGIPLKSGKRYTLFVGEKSSFLSDKERKEANVSEDVEIRQCVEGEKDEMNCFPNYATLLDGETNERTVFEEENDVKNIVGALSSQNTGEKGEQESEMPRPSIIVFNEGNCVKILEEGKKFLKRIAPEENIFFSVSNDKRLAKLLKTEFPGIYCRTSESVSYRTRIDSSEEGADVIKQVEKTMAMAVAPLFQSVTKENYDLYQAANLPILFVADHKSSFPDLTWVRSVAIDFREKVKFVLLGFEDHPQFIESLGIAESDFPSFFLFNEENTEKFLLRRGEIENSEEGGSTEEKNLRVLSSFVRRYLEKTLDPYYLSEDEPVENTGPVKILVAKSIRSEIEDPEKDVLVMFHAPWCGYCREMSPILDGLGEMVRKNGLEDRVLIAKIDMTKNDVKGQDIRGYPTLKLFTSGEKKETLFTGRKRTLESLSEFIRENGQHKVSIVREHDEKMKEEL